jgi:hypothetical protein
LQCGDGRGIKRIGDKSSTKWHGIPDESGNVSGSRKMVVCFLSVQDAYFITGEMLLQLLFCELTGASQVSLP